MMRKFYFSLLFLNLAGVALSQISFRIQVVDGVLLPASIVVKNNFAGKDQAVSYAGEIAKNLLEEGYASNSLDTIVVDTTSITAYFFLGKKYTWQALNTSQVEQSLLEAVDWKSYLFNGTPYNSVALEQKLNTLLDYLENNGYPFAKAWVDSIYMNGANVTAALHVKPGGLYVLDSIQVAGNAPVSNRFLQQYLELPKGAIYSRQKIEKLEEKLAQLSYLEIRSRPQLRWLSKGYVLELNLAPRKTNRFNLLLGFLPNQSAQAASKLLLTGDASILLNNELGAGETFSFSWQRMQASSPRLQFFYTQPYLFKLPIGADISFNMYKRDTTFLNIDMKAGGIFHLGKNRQATISVQRFISQSSVADKQAIIQYKVLPPINNISRSTLGLEYNVNVTNSLFNPTRGSVLSVSALLGTRRIKKNNDILELKDPIDPSYNFNRLYDSVKLSSTMAQVNVQAARYLPIGNKGRSTVKLSMNGAIYLNDVIFKNEMFQIGGYKLLRGFDDESQFLSQYTIGTAEYRYLVGERSYFFTFMDGGWGADKSYKTHINYTYASTGLGMSFETKAGLFNLAWAIGKRNDEPFNLRKSKIHIGFTNTF